MQVKGNEVQVGDTVIRGEERNEILRLEPPDYSPAVVAAYTAVGPIFFGKEADMAIERP